MATIAVYLLTYGGAAVALFNPFYGLLVYIVMAILRPDSLWHWVAVPGNSSRIVAIAMLIGWVIHGFGDRRLGRGKSVALAFVGFWGWSVVSSSLAAEDPSKGYEYVELLSKILLPFLVGMTTIRTIGQLRLLAWTMVLSLGYVAFDLNQSYYGGYNRLYFDGFGGMDNNCVAIAMVTGTGLGGFLVLAPTRWWQKGVTLLAVALMINAICFSNSRGGMLALMCMGVVAFFLIPKRFAHYMAFLVVLAVGYRLMGAEALTRFKTAFTDRQERDASAQSRLDMWRSCWDVMLRYPAFGCGPENWGEVAPQYGWPRGKYAHSLWVQTGAETGFPGLQLLLSFYGFAIVGAWRLTRRPAGTIDPFLQDLARAVIAALVGFMIAAQFVSLWQLEMPYYVAMLGAAAIKLSTFGPKPPAVPATAALPVAPVYQPAIAPLLVHT